MSLLTDKQKLLKTLWERKETCTNNWHFLILFTKNSSLPPKNSIFELHLFGPLQMLSIKVVDPKWALVQIAVKPIMSGITSFECFKYEKLKTFIHKK